MIEWLAIVLIGAGWLWEAMSRRRQRKALQRHLEIQQRINAVTTEALNHGRAVDQSIADQVLANVGILRSHQAAIESANEVFRNQGTINGSVLEQLAEIRTSLESPAVGQILRTGHVGDYEHLEPGTVRAVDPDQCLTDLNARLKELEALVDTMVTGSLPADDEG